MASSRSNLSALTNGQGFMLTLPAAYGTGDNIQYGLEWSGPPVRSDEHRQLRLGHHQHQWGSGDPTVRADECLCVY